VGCGEYVGLVGSTRGKIAVKLARQSPRLHVERGGKSGLRRARCRLTTGHREVMNSATENSLPNF
jgi:hypothetical protein